VKKEENIIEVKKSIIQSL